MVSCLQVSEEGLVRSRYAHPLLSTRAACPVQITWFLKLLPRRRNPRETENAGDALEILTMPYLLPHHSPQAE